MTHRAYAPLEKWRIPAAASDLTDPKWDHGSTDGEIFVNIRDGVAPQMKMKAFKGKVSDQDIWNIVNYLRSIESKK